jgi:Phage integrase family
VRSVLGGWQGAEPDRMRRLWKLIPSRCVIANQCASMSDPARSCAARCGGAPNGAHKLAQRVQTSVDDERQALQSEVPEPGRSRGRRGDRPCPIGTFARYSNHHARSTERRPCTVSTSQRKWHKITKTAGVQPIRLHDARHSCGNALHLRAVPLAMIAKWLRHADAATTAPLYAHSQDAALMDAAKSLGGVDAPIAVRKSSGGQPLAVVVGEGVIALVSAFEPGDGDGRDAEMGGDGG